MSIQNAEAANASLDALESRREEKVQERQEAQSLADKLLTAREQETVTLELDGVDVEFRVMLGDVRDEIEEVQQEVARLADKTESADEDDDVEELIGMTEEEALEQVESYRDRFIEILVDHSIDDSLDRGFWLQAYGRSAAGQIARRLKQKSERADMTEEELRQFRNQ